MTLTQLAALKAAIVAETDPAIVAARSAGNLGAMVDFFNTPTTFIVWRTSVSTAELHSAYVWTEMDTLAIPKYQQLTLLLAPGAINPSLANVRQGVLDIFSGAGLAATRTALVALAKRAATRAEKVLATGTGTTAVPGLLSVEGPFLERDLTAAWNG